MRKFIAIVATTALLTLLVFQSIYMPYAYAQLPAPGFGPGGGGTSGKIPVVTLAQLATIPCNAGATGSIRFVSNAPVTTGGTYIYLCNGTSWLQQGSVGNADGSITLVSSGGLIDIQVTPGVFAGLNLNNTYGSNASQNFENAYVLPPTKEFADLPSANTVTGDVFVVVDCTTAACTAGTGDPATGLKVWLRSNGATYDVVSPGSTIEPLATQFQGSLWPHDYPSTQANGATFQDAEIYYEEFTPKASITVTNVAVYVGIPGLAGQYISFGFYTEAGALIAQTTPLLATAGPGAVLLTFPSPPTLTINEPVIMAMGCTGTATLTIYEGVATTAPAILNSQATPRQFVDNQSIASPGASQTLPATIGTKTANFRFNGWIMAFFP